MKIRLISVELLRHRARVRRAERLVRRDKADTAKAIKHLTQETIATPGGIAACATAGLLFERLTATSSSATAMSRIQRAVQMLRSTLDVINNVKSVETTPASESHSEQRASRDDSPLMNSNA